MFQTIGKYTNWVIVDPILEMVRWGRIKISAWNWGNCPDENVFIAYRLTQNSCFDRKVVL